MARVLLDEVIDTDYGQFDLVWSEGFGFDGDFDRCFAGQVNGLVGAASGDGLYVNLARRSGGSPVRIVLLENAPDRDEELWEDVVEVSISIPPGERPGWCTWAGESGGALDLPGGDYRVRASARGRDAGHDGEFADGAVDFYLLEFWPAAGQPDAIIRTSSANAAYWHHELGNRR